MDYSVDFNLLKLPDELLQHILLKLDWKSIFQSILICQKFKNILTNELYWKAKCDHDFGLGSPLLLTTENKPKVWLKDKFFADLPQEPETWRRRYRRIYLAKSCQNRISTYLEDYGLINLDGQLIMTNSPKSKPENRASLFPVEFPGRLIDFSYHKQSSLAVTERGKVYTWVHLSITHSSTLKRVLEYDSYALPHQKEEYSNLNLIKFIMSNETDINIIKHAFITDDLAGYIEVDVMHLDGYYKTIIKLSIPVRDISITNNLATLLGKDRQIYLFSLNGHVTIKGSNLSLIEIDQSGSWFKFFTKNQNFGGLQYVFENDYKLYSLQLPEYLFRQAIPTRSSILTLTMDGKIIEFLYNVHERYSKYQYQIEILHKIKIFSRVSKIFTNFFNVKAAITEQGELYVWGTNQNNMFYQSGRDQLTIHDLDNVYYYPRPVKVPLERKVESVGIGDGYLVILMKSGQIKITGKISSSSELYLTDSEDEY